MAQFFLYLFGYFMIFRAIDLGRVESEKYGLFTQIGFIQWLMVMGASILLSWGDQM
jgi:hypothetical protein